MNAPPLRSDAWFEGTSETALQNRAALRSSGVGLGPRERRGPVIGISNTVSDLNPCNRVLSAQIEAARLAVLEAGGVPVVFPTISLGEDLMKPTAMLYRNLLSIEVEEMIRSHPLDAVLLTGNCDKTIPGSLMGAISADVPTGMIIGGPRRRACFQGRQVASGTDLWREFGRLRAGEIDDEEWLAFEAAYSEHAGACNVMGTAQTMAILTEVMGFAVAGAASVEAGDPAGIECARRTARAVVRLAVDPIPPTQLVTLASLRNALVVLNAIGGSTNAILHLVAMAGRAALTLDYEQLQEALGERPVLVDVMPTGSGYAQDFQDSGGVARLLAGLREHLDLTTPTIEGRPLSETVAPDRPEAAGAIRGPDRPVAPRGLAMVRGSLAPDGAVIKVSAASPALLEHRGPAVVFDGYEDMVSRIDDESLPVTPSSVLVLRHGGPVGGPGMPEWGMVPIPAKLARSGTRDMLRVTDARMSGTSFGTVVLHVSPESAVGGPLSLVRDGDLIALSLADGSLELEVDESVLDRRRAQTTAPVSAHRRGWVRLYQSTVMQAPSGCDMDFLKPSDTSELSMIEPTVGRS